MDMKHVSIAGTWTGIGSSFVLNSLEPEMWKHHCGDEKSITPNFGVSTYFQQTSWWEARWTSPGKMYPLPMEKFKMTVSWDGENYEGDRQFKAR